MPMSFRDFLTDMPLCFRLKTSCTISSFSNKSISIHYLVFVKKNILFLQCAVFYVLTVCKEHGTACYHLEPFSVSSGVWPFLESFWNHLVSVWDHFSWVFSGPFGNCLRPSGNCLGLLLWVCLGLFGVCLGQNHLVPKKIFLAFKAYLASEAYLALEAYLAFKAHLASEAHLAFDTT